ncbi:type II toxin-antitoxin system PemK/MazF family toxin [Salicibibacter cibarius]|uniref:Type II toxin-antitoxin system PemK/MazF family toxin n=1 Tax=Salicibibacter cibarius TaxID=2743000 RepID=A0A7T7CC65_9BACI|nr:type II toxin-antitoxin system PemK/MazF family toxin [Salicibibacter cibarius]QQK76679.1 type II toxin-antitoxin system PemK/MazF family toxin [Salicibibacter cibarius]
MLKQGDIIVVNVNPTKGHEQAGHRPFIILSNKHYNEVSTLAIGCSISKTSSDWVFNVGLPGGMQTTGKIKTDQLRSLDLKARGYRFVESAPKEVVSEALEKLGAIVDYED